MTVSDVKASFDFSGMASLKAKAAANPNDDATVKETAKQFESMLLRMMLKSMRDATPDGGLFSSKSTKTFEDMFDQQIVMAMAERGATGISQMVESFISQSRGSESLETSSQSFSLNSVNKNNFPLVQESTSFSISEEATRDFLINRNKQFLGGDL